MKLAPVGVVIGAKNLGPVILLVYSSMVSFPDRNDGVLQDGRDISFWSVRSDVTQLCQCLEVERMVWDQDKGSEI